MRSLFLCVVFAANVFGASVNLDPQTGLWFPPGASREDYLSRKAPYGRHLRQAFENDPQLARDVCAAYSTRATRSDTPAIDPSVQQMMEMLHTQCAALAMKAADEQSARAVTAVAEGRLDALLDEALAAAAATPAAERRARHQEAIAAAERASNDDEWLRLALRGIALRPQNSRGAHLLLSRDTDVHLASGIVLARTLADYAERIYRLRANDADWRGALGEVLLYRGKLAEARAILAEQTRPSKGPLSYDDVALAVMNDMAGRDDGLSSIASRCDASCWDIVYSIAARTVRALGKAAPPRTADILLEVTRKTTDRPMKLAIARELTALDPALAARQNMELATAPGASAGEVIDATRSLAEAEHRNGNTLKAIALLDCWIARRFGAIAPFPGDGWRQIAERLRARDDRGDKACADDPNAAMCIYGALLKRYGWAMERGRHDLARQSLEMLASAVLQRRVKANTIPPVLMTMAAELRDRADESDRAAHAIAAYVAAQPHDATTAHNLKSFPSLASTVALEPFASPAAVADLPIVCRDGTIVQ